MGLSRSFEGLLGFRVQGLGLVSPQKGLGV